MTLNKKWGDSREQMFGKISLRKRVVEIWIEVGRKVGRKVECGYVDKNVDN